MVDLVSESIWKAVRLLHVKEESSNSVEDLQVSFSVTESEEQMTDMTSLISRTSSARRQIVAMAQRGSSACDGNLCRKMASITLRREAMRYQFQQLFNSKMHDLFLYLNLECREIPPNLGFGSANFSCHFFSCSKQNTGKWCRRISCGRCPGSTTIS